MQISEENTIECKSLHQERFNREINQDLILESKKDIEISSNSRISKEKREELNAYARYLYSIYQKRKESLNNNK